MTTTTSPTLPPELVAKAAEAIRALPMWGDALYPAATLAPVSLEAADVPGLLAERDRLRADNSRLYGLTVTDTEEVQASADFFRRLAAIARALPPESAHLAEGLKALFDKSKTYSFACKRDRDETRAALAAIEKRLAEKCTATCMTTEDYTVIMEARRVLGSKERA